MTRFDEVLQITGINMQMSFINPIIMNFLQVCYGGVNQATGCAEQDVCGPKELPCVWDVI